MPVLVDMAQALTLSAHAGYTLEGPSMLHAPQLPLLVPYCVENLSTFSTCKRRNSERRLTVRSCNTTDPLLEEDLALVEDVQRLALRNKLHVRHVTPMQENADGC